MVKKVGWGVGLLLVCGVFLFIAATLQPGTDIFKFLGGRGPIFGGVAPSFGRAPFGLDYSVYSWQESYRDVVANAKVELKGLGYKVSKEDLKGIHFQKPESPDVVIKPGQSRNKRVDFWGPKTGDESWVTVQIVEEADGSLATQLRSALEPEH